MAWVAADRAVRMARKLGHTGPVERWRAMRDRMTDGFVLRYPTSESNDIDGLPGAEGVFLACSFWLAEALALIGRKHEATELFERLPALTDVVGLLAEEYDPIQRRQLGNFPQAFPHINLIHTAEALSRRSGRGGPAMPVSCFFLSFDRDFIAMSSVAIRVIE
jgi:GH15 family glucan-1,4-alpha-glucosidase